MRTELRMIYAPDWFGQGGNGDADMIGFVVRIGWVIGDECVGSLMKKIVSVERSGGRQVWPAGLELFCNVNKANTNRIKKILIKNKIKTKQK